jgi:2-polyprenyl-3-methyl-5-hydroxy-6-metoxy-1,4-benzoquinol methylase
MLGDPVRQSQLYLRRAGRRLRGSAYDSTRIDDLDDVAREHFFEEGQARVRTLTRRIERYAGFQLEGQTALDFGCGVGRMTLAIAERCAHAYGVDVSPAVLRMADENAKRMNVTNVEWLPSERLAELDARYDLVVSMYVFQHIPSREGERLFSTLVRGLRPGGAGAIHVTVRPGQPLARMSRWARNPRQRTLNPLTIVRDWDWSYPYHVVHSYSLNRLGRLLAAEGVTEWHVHWHARRGAGLSYYETATIVFRKP